MEGEAYIHYKSMLISLALHLILLMFELLVCDKLESGRHLWILVFIPLIFISIVSIAVCIWAVKHDRSFEVRNNMNPQLFPNISFPAGTFLRRQRAPVHLPRPEARQIHHVVLGSCLRPALDRDVSLAGKPGASGKFDFLPMCFRWASCTR